MARGQKGFIPEQGLFSQKCGPINHRSDLAWYPELQGNTVLLALVTQREIKK